MSYLQIALQLPHLFGIQVSPIEHGLGWHGSEQDTTFVQAETNKL